MSVATMPTKSPRTSVLLMAVSKDGIASTRWNTESVGPLSPTTASTSRIASGYRMNRVKNTIRTMIVVTSIGSASNFFWSSRAL